jgi:hypothetical protein
VLLPYGGLFAAVAFGRGVPAFDDHPGQFFRLWHALERSLPAGHWTADWNPDWWGGYPELQFYPPGFALLAALLRLALLWQPSVETVYQLLCALTLLLPAVTTFGLVASLVEDAWLALPPAFLALTLSAGLRSGVEESLRWGMLTSRLSAGLLPLLVLALRGWIETGRRPTWAPAVGAAVILAHPVNAPAVVVVVTVAALARGTVRLDAGVARIAAATVGLGGLLTAFWTVPLLIRRAWMVPLTWGHPDPGIAGLPRSAAVLGILLAALLAWAPVIARRRPAEVAIALHPWALLALGLIDQALFLRGLSPIEPARLADATVTAALWAGGLGAAFLAERLRRRPARPRPLFAAGTTVAVAAAAHLAGPVHGEPVLSLWPHPAAWPTLAEVVRARDLGRLWGTLRNQPDRVLFLTAAVPLGPGGDWHAPHSHVLSLTPLHAGREVIHGTFTHPAPLAGRFYTGAAAAPTRLPLLAETLDGERILGERWAQLPPETFEAFARRLRIATVVAPTTVLSRARFLGDRYAPTAAASGFTVLQRRDRPWPSVERVSHRRYRVQVPTTGGVWIPTGIAAYPAWKAKGGSGPLETRVDAWGLLEFRVPVDLFEAELTYAEGPLEWLSLGLTALGVLAWIAWASHAPGSRHAGPPPAARSALDRRRRR